MHRPEKNHLHGDCHLIPIETEKLPDRAYAWGRVRQFRCDTHGVIVGPSGWELGWYGGYESGKDDVAYSRQQREYVTDNLYRFLCRYIYNYFEKIVPSSCYLGEPLSHCHARQQKYIKDCVDSRLESCESDVLIDVYCHLTNTDRSIIVNKIKAHICQ